MMQDWQIRLGQAFNQRLAATGFTDIRLMKLGKADDPYTVVVPKANREYPTQECYYAHAALNGSVVDTQLLNWANSGVMPTNSTPELDVITAFPPGETRRHIIAVALEGMTLQGGTPATVATLQAMLTDTNRMVQNSIYAAGGLVVGLRGGRYRRGNTNIHLAENTSFTDLTAIVADIPGGHDRWVLVSVDSTGAAHTTEGEDFESTFTDPINFRPVALPSSTLYLGAVRLTSGMTSLTGVVQNDSDIFNVLPVFVQATEPDETFAADVWIDTSAGNIIKIRNTANDAWESITSNKVTVLDTNLTIQDNADATKQGQFQLAGLPTATTITLDWPLRNTGLVIKTPGASSDNVIQPSGDFIPLVLKQFAGQTNPHLQMVDSDGNELVRFGPETGDGGTFKVSYSVAAISSLEFTISSASPNLKMDRWSTGQDSLISFSTTTSVKWSIGQLAAIASDDLIIGYNGLKTVRLGQTSEENVLVIESSGEVGIGTLTPGGRLHIVNAAAGAVGLVVQGAASQSANLLTLQDSSATGVFGISPSGRTRVGSSAVPTIDWLLINQNTSILSGSDNGIRSVFNSNPSASTSAALIAISSQVSISAGNAQNHTDALSAISASVSHGGTGTLTRAEGVRIVLSASSTGTISAAYGIRILAPINSGGGAISTAVGIEIGDHTVGGTNIALRTNAGLVILNEGGNANSDVRIEGDTDQNLLFSDASADAMGIGLAAPAAKLHIDQSSTTAAKPVLTVDQADVSEEFIRFIGSSANGVLTQSIVEAADVATPTLAGYLKIYVQDDGNQLTDQSYFIPIYTLA